jgi:UDP-3-O-[3-hydroxymyristoyl] glucosamine N-acyltransferase
MGVNKRFFIKNTISIKNIIEKTSAKIIGNTTIDINDIDTLKDAKNGDISFFHNRKYSSDFKNSKASFIFCNPKDTKDAPIESIILEHDNPYFAYSQTAEIMYKIKIDYPDQINMQGFESQISEYARIGQNVQIGKNCVVEDGVIIKNGVILGDNVIIKSNSVIGYGVQIGDNTTVDYNAVIEFAKIGSNCHIYSGAKIGQRGYGFAFDIATMQVIDVPQLGGVFIDDFVDIGSNTTIDRGAINDTIIGKYTKIDNLVQIGHNVNIGLGCSIVAQVGIAGGTEIGNLTTLSGQVGVAGHIKIGNQVVITAQSGINGNIPDGAVYSGSPAMDNKLWKRAMARMSIDAKKR